MTQLIMQKDDLGNVPAIPVPEGYLSRTYRQGDEPGLARVYETAKLGPGTVEHFRERMLGHPCFRPDRIRIVEFGGEPVATASAWVEVGIPGLGWLHMVGVLPEHRGRKLGAIVTIEAIGYTKAEGLPSQRLSTDDWREPAIRLYLNLGYYPLITDDSHPRRWETLAKKLGRPDILDKARIFDG